MQVLFGKNKGFYKGNLHCHTVFSDGYKTPEEIKQMYKEKGYYDKLERYYKFFKYREMKLKLKTKNKIDADVFSVLLHNQKVSYFLYLCILIMLICTYFP